MLHVHGDNLSLFTPQAYLDTWWGEGRCAIHLRPAEPNTQLHSLLCTEQATGKGMSEVPAVIQPQMSGGGKEGQVVGVGMAG